MENDPGRPAFTAAIARRFFEIFPALAVRNYRLFLSGHAISVIGTWMQGPVLQWVVYDITKSKEALGLVGFLDQLPTTLLVILAGVMADRYSRRNIVTVTQICLMCIALSLGILTITGNLTIGWIYVISIASGTAKAFDQPARQAFVVEVAGRNVLSNAIAINSAIFNTARIIGPTIGALVLAEFGAAFCFFSNAASFLAIIVALVAIRGLYHRPMTTGRRGMSDLADGLRYVWRHADIRILLVLTGAFSLFGTYYATLLPAFVRDVYGKAETAYGLQISFLGVGALAGALFMAAISNRGHQNRCVVFGMAIMCLALALLSVVRNHPVVCAIYAVHGFGMVTFMVSGNTLVQQLSDPYYQGRTMGIRHFVFGGMWTFGSLIAGYMGRLIGLRFTVAAGVVVMAIALIVCARRVLSINPLASQPAPPADAPPAQPQK